MDSSKLDSSTSLQDSMLKFTLEHLHSSNVGPRLGQLLCGHRKAIETPHYVAITSRGVVPHLSHDTLQKHTAVSSIYLGLEDFIEKEISHAPIFQTPAKNQESPLRKYIVIHDDILTILGPRRVPAVPCPTHNTGSAISICTSVGFSQLGADAYHDAIQRLRPDIAIAMADVIATEAASIKRREKSADRTHAWLRDFTQDLLPAKSLLSSPAIFAALPPIANLQQSLYLQDLGEEYCGLISGLALYSSNTAADLPQPLNALPRICLAEPGSPHSLLKDMMLGIDLHCVPFVMSSSDHGIALAFEFPGLNLDGDKPQPLGLDLWSSVHEASLVPLSSGCDCFTCTRHHRAYVHHLLQTKEMLAWTLLQLHNLATMDRFFETCRRSIAKATFVDDVKAFHRKYEAEMPTKTGLGPRVRGYQTKSTGGGEAKKNAKSWGGLGDAAQKIAEAESGSATPEGDSRQLEQQGFAERA